jgi:general secretion pathway protein I
LKKNNHQGFSLLEILVAFSILAVSLTILLNIFASGLNATSTAEDYTLAVQIAESLMAKTGVETPLQISQTSGIVHNKYRWQITIQPFVFSSEPINPPPPVNFFKVKVLVTWGDNETRSRQIKLVTLKLTNRPL